LKAAGNKRIGMIGHDDRSTAVVFGCLLLAACAGSTGPTQWVKAGADDEAVARELRDCSAQAQAALASERGINEDINATLGRNWVLSHTVPVEQQSLRSQAADYAEQVRDSCMRAKGFVKEG
jgi:hypothetical protein